MCNIDIEEVTEDIGYILLPNLDIIHFLGLSGSTTLFATDQICAFMCNKVTQYVFTDIGITGKYKNYISWYSFLNIVFEFSLNSHYSFVEKPKTMTYPYKLLAFRSFFPLAKKKIGLMLAKATKTGCFCHYPWPQRHTWPVASARILTGRSCTETQPSCVLVCLCPKRQGVSEKKRETANIIHWCLWKTLIFRNWGACTHYSPCFFRASDWISQHQ